MARLMPSLFAIKSGEGYFMLPEPATRHAVQFPVFQKRWMSSRSAFAPFGLPIFTLVEAKLLVSCFFLSILFFSCVKEANL